jgi:C4-dicarboxylate-specific signal transduction histidine kinase
MMSNLSSESDVRLRREANTALHLRPDEERARPQTSRQAERLDQVRRALLTLGMDMQEVRVPLETTRNAMIDIICDLREAAADIQRREQQLREKQEQLTQAGMTAALTEMATGMAHELSNPLNNIGLFIGNAIDLAESEAADKARVLREMRKAMQQVRHATQIVSHLHTIGRPESVRHEAVSLERVIGRALALVREQLRLLEIDVTLDPTLGQAVVLGNPTQLEQVFINLFTNARDALAGAASGVIRISVTMGPGSVEVVFADTGPGIPPGLERRIFDPFFTTKEAGKGTGLGLSITQRIVKEHKGSILVGSPSGGGATFLIRLPLATIDAKGAASR